MPIGDGLDYEVRESTETVLSMLEGAPPAKVVPVPPPQALTPRPDDVSPDVDPRGCGRGGEEESGSVPQKKVRKTKAASKTANSVRRAKDPADAQSEGQEKDESAAAPRKARAASRKKASGSDSAEPPPDAFEEIIGDLRARKCRTVKRMRNAIKSFYGKTDDEEVERIVEAMIAGGHILVGADGHVNWTVQVV